MKKTLLGLVALFLLISAGCTSAYRARITAYGSPSRVTVYSGGKAVATYESTGKVMTEANSDGWYFEDAKTRKLVHVAGTVVIEQE